MRNYTKDSRCVWSKTICGGLPFPQAGRPDNGNYLDGGSIIVELQIVVPKDAVIAAK